MQKTIALFLSLLSLVGSSFGCSAVENVKLTAYGFPDASGTPAYKCHGNTVVPTVAGDKTLLGDGSFNKPYAAAASANSIFAKCSLVYIPLFEKYFRVQDDCSGCTSTWMDLYIIDQNKNVGQSQCEIDFGTYNYGKALHEVVKAPASSYKVDTRPLFSNGKCFNKVSDGRVYPSRDGTFKCPAAGSAKAEVVDTSAAQPATHDTPLIDGGDPASRHHGMQGTNATTTASAFSA